MTVKDPYLTLLKLEKELSGYVVVCWAVVNTQVSLRPRYKANYLVVGTLLPT